MKRSLGAGGIVIALALLGGASSSGAQGSRDVRAGSSTRPLPPTDPGEAAFLAAIAPGLADSTAARLNAFLARFARHARAPEARHELGLLAYARGDYAIARREFRRARGPGVGEEARYGEALAAFALGRPRDARALVLPLAQARRETPRRRDAAYLVALSWAQEGHRVEALAAYQLLFALVPRRPEAAALYQAASLARELGRSEDAA
jgi:tetratricopeptide (TPR) repeat protein